ncbi:MAG: phenylalanine--tRNA ligase subunit alpha, partial [Alphaproteobacteria bacterium]|nr:phenylalanine--tRNA ligase subunit alpha [Alphaproteobacteria bacterium]
MQSQLPTWLNQIIATTDLPQLEALKTGLLGKSGEVTQALKGLAQLSSIDEKKAKGAEINAVRDSLTEAFQNQVQILEKKAVEQKLTAEALDVTLPSPTFTQSGALGRIHPLTALKEEISDFFQKRGFTFAEGPEVDDEWHNFDALNIPAHHPARQNHDTFFIKGHLTHLLRTHTSTVQIRSLATQKPPLRLLSVGRVYRSDDLDATHTPMFHQIEGLVLDKDIHMGHLKGLIREFCSTLFG